MPAFILMVAACFLGRLFVKMAYRPATYAPTLHTRPSLVESVSILLIGAAVMRVKNTIAMIIMSWLSVQVVSIVAAAETITWSGYEWKVRSSRGAAQGPGPNIFSDSRDNVFVDSKGDLHLRITQREDKKWVAAEIDLTQSLGYGTYQWELSSRYDRLPSNVVVGLFTYISPRSVARQTDGVVGNQKPDTPHEIDIEFTGAWGDANHILHDT